MKHDYLTSALRLLSFKETADFLRMQETEFRNFVRLKPDGFPEAVKPGKKIYYKLAELELWLLGSTASSRHLKSSDTEGGNFATRKKRPRGRPRKPSKSEVRTGEGG